MVSLVIQVPFKSGAVPTLLMLLSVVVPVFVILLMFWRFGWMAITIRPERPIHWFLSDLRAILLDPERMLGGALAFLAICLFAGTFAFLKDMVPVIVPFSWDPAFAAWDRALHGGQDPWILLLPVFGSPVMTTALNAVYHFWFFLLYFCVFMACFDMRAPRKSMTFLVAFVLTWVLGGNLLATVFSSVGPVYYEVLGFGDDFVPLMDRLHAVAQISPVWALDVHDMLLDGYLNDGPMKGISAMPSMHVGSCVIMTLYCFSLRRWLGWLMLTFTLLIQIGSVHLAWHYAIDGYFAAVVAILCWWLAQGLVRRFSPIA